MSEGPIPLQASAADVRHWGELVIARLADYFASMREHRVYPQTSAREIRTQLTAALPVEGSSFDSLLDDFFSTIVPLSRQNAHPRMFGYVQSPGSALAAFADLLASSLNANLTAWRSAPAPVELERLTLDWLKEILGLDRSATGLLVSGGSMANLAALAAAREWQRAVNDSRKPLRLYASEETHHSIAKAAALLGLEQDMVRMIPADADFKIQLEQLVAAIEADVHAGYFPFCLVGNAGTVTTGAIDPLPELVDVARRFGLWLHVDASYGAFAALTDAARPLLRPMAQAHSVALDPHKWLYLPVDCGCVFYRDPQAARAAFGYTAEYTRVMDLPEEESFAFWDYGPELSRRFRALKLWMVLQGVGTRALGEAIAKDMACARHLEQLVRMSDDFEMLAPVELSIFCFRYWPPELRKQMTAAGEQSRSAVDAEVDRVNEQLLVKLQRDGSSYLSNAQLHGRFALRGCVMNYATTLRDMEILLDDLRRVASQL